MDPSLDPPATSPVDEARQRFLVSRRGNLTRKPVDKTSLSKLEQRLLDLVCYGLDRALPHYPDVPPGQPLNPLVAGDMLRMRRSRVRTLLKEPAWHKAMAAEVAKIKSGASVRAVNRIVETIDEVGADKAADRKVRLEAAAMILGDAVGKSAPSVNVNVQTNVVTPGYVIDLSPQPLTIDGEPQT